MNVVSSHSAFSKLSQLMRFSQMSREGNCSHSGPALVISLQCSGNLYSRVGLFRRWPVIGQDRTELPPPHMPHRFTLWPYNPRFPRFPILPTSQTRPEVQFPSPALTVSTLLYRLFSWKSSLTVRNLR